VGIDLRYEMKHILKEYGHQVLLQRTSRRIRCSCWSELYQEADKSCLLCGGTGWIIRIEKHIARGHDASLAVSKPDRVEDSRIGDIHTAAHVFYFEWNVHPRVKDMIYEVGWDKFGKPVNLIKAHEINNIQMERGDGGRTEFYVAYTKLSTVNLDMQNIIVQNIRIAPNNRLTR